MRDVSSQDKASGMNSKIRISSMVDHGVDVAYVWDSSGVLFVCLFGSSRCFYLDHLENRRGSWDKKRKMTL